MSIHKCEKGHNLKWLTELNIKGYVESGTYGCDKCDKSNEIKNGVWHCEQNCQYDICPNCRPNPNDQIEEEKLEAILGLPPKDKIKEEKEAINFVMP